MSSNLIARMFIFLFNILELCAFMRTSNSGTIHHPCMFIFPFNILELCAFMRTSDSPSKFYILCLLAHDSVFQLLYLNTLFFSMALILSQCMGILCLHPGDFIQVDVIVIFLLQI